LTEESSNLNMLSAFIGAIIGSIVTILSRWILFRIELNRKKKLMNDDLIHQQDVFIEYKKVTETLLNDFEKKENLDRRSHPSFEDLYTDIYESLSKPDLFIIYQNKLPKIVQIYKSIEFLKEYKPSKIYAEYIDKWDTHRKLQEHLDHMNKYLEDDYCGAQIGYMNHAIGQLKLNLDTITEVERDINSALSYKFHWLNPF
jgi:hypothetical protein